MRGAIGRHALGQLPDSYNDVVRTTMLIPAWRRAMFSRPNLAMHSGKPGLENLFTDAELRGIELPVRLIFGDADVYGGPKIGECAASLIPDARLDVLPGGHAPCLDDPVRCAELIRARP
jgi:pimeloyl-ACP methyl ester carboxylesterase